MPRAMHLVLAALATVAVACSPERIAELAHTHAAPPLCAPGIIPGEIGAFCARQQECNATAEDVDSCECRLAHAAKDQTGVCGPGGGNSVLAYHGCLAMKACAELDSDVCDEHLSGGCGGDQILPVPEDAPATRAGDDAR